MTAQQHDEGPAAPTAADDADPSTTALDKRLVQERNHVSVLHWLHRFGWLTSRMLAALVWSDAAQPLAMARRTLKVLAAQKLVICRPLPKGGAAYLVAAKGARYLRERFGIHAVSGNNLALGNPVHRACSNWFLIGAHQQGLDIVTEHEIASERGPIRYLKGKSPDGLVVCEGHAIWIECENAPKSRAERRKIVALVEQNIGHETFTELAPELFLSRVAIVATTWEALRSIAASFEEALRLGEIRYGQIAEVDVCVLAISESLTPGERIDANLWFDLIGADPRVNE